jgi:hypothetical protein
VKPVSRVDDEYHHLGTIETDGHRYDCDCRVVWDGVEFVGRLWFTGESDEDGRIPDRGALPGRTREEVVALAERLTVDELRVRLARAHAEKRRFLNLRSVTAEILSKIRYVNQLAASVRAGLVDSAGAAAEIELTEHQLHDLVDLLKEHAGIEKHGISE